MPRSSRALAPVLVGLAASLLLDASAAAPAGDLAWDARRAEHLLNRAAFGAGWHEIRAAVEAGPEAVVDELLRPRPPLEVPTMPLAASLRRNVPHPVERHAGLTSRRAGYVQSVVDQSAPMAIWGNAWVESMLRGADPLRDRMTLFWHNHFVSSVQDVVDGNEMVAQLAFLREHALDRFEVLARGIARDPAMLEYLDNNVNVKGHPNENWARELFELFMLGDGNYTEDDIKEAARAFTGWTDELSTFVFDRRQHDYGQKTVLGVTGQLDGDDVIAIALAEPACPRWLAGKLLRYFEGVEPGPERLERYAGILRDADLDLSVFLRALFLDEGFYREEVVGQRVAGPIDFLVGSARRLQAAAPAQLVLAGGDALGQRLFWPPSVKGWEGGMGWITTASLMHRGNLAGILLGLLTADDVLVDLEFAPDDAAMGRVRSRSSAFLVLQFLADYGWRPDLDLPGLVSGLGAGSTDAEVTRVLLHELLAVEPAPGTAPRVAAVLADLRAEEGVAEAALLSGSPASRSVLRRAAHVVLSLPDAQLN